MPESFYSFVDNLSDDDFASLKKAVARRENIEKYGAATFEELAYQYERKIVCPKCGSESVVKNGLSHSGRQRFLCKDCGRKFTYLSKSIFASTKLDLDKISKTIVLMTFNLPLEAIEEVVDISHPTAYLWRQKILAAVNGWQDRVVLKGRVWIDETYIFDSRILHEDGYQVKRGLSKNLICIAVGIDQYENIYVKICGNGKPSGKRILSVFKDHIEPGSTLVHDGENAHNMLIDKLGLISETHIYNDKNPEYIKNMALINNLCSWLKRYLYRFIGMKLDYLQLYLDWFAYLFRVKKQDEKWPKNKRVLRHLILSDAEFTRGYYLLHHHFC